MSIGEQGHHSFAEECWDQGFDLEFVYVGSCLFAAKAVIEEELVVLEQMFEKDLNALIAAFDIELVILTLGADGSEIHQAGQCFKHAAIPGEVIDTVGAGDSFTSCFISHYMSNGDIAAAQAIASKLAAYVCAHSGATVTLPEELKTLDSSLV